MMNNTTDILSRGMEVLINNLGSVEAEKFLSTAMRERFDYTKWQRQFFDSMEPGEFHENALKYAQTHPSW